MRTLLPMLIVVGGSASDSITEKAVMDCSRHINWNKNKKILKKCQNSLSVGSAEFDIRIRHFEGQKD
jgi:hypothetical protein